MRRIAARVLAAVFAGALLLAVVMRVVPDDPADWHADPLSAGRTGAPNDFVMLPEAEAGTPADRLSAVYDLPAAMLMKRIDEVALSEPRTRRIAGSADALWATYVQRSAVFGFPDYVSVRAIGTEAGSALSIWSRSRFGHDDFGVNRDRVERWLAEIGAGT